MADAADALHDPMNRPADREDMQRDWILASAECSRRAREVLNNAVGVLADVVPGRSPDGELAGAWAALGQGWATLSHAEAARSIALAALATGPAGVDTGSTSPNPST